jgi:thiol-disulfide isomerase/thioredoxin
MTTRIPVLLVLTLALVACDRAGISGQPGTYRVALTLPGGELPFGLDLEHTQGVWSGDLINGPERVHLSEVTVNGSHLEIRMPGFENRLKADAQAGAGDGALKGEMVISKPNGRDQHLPLTAQLKQSWRFFPPAPAGGLDVAGRWAVTFTADDGSEEAAVGEFSQSQDIVTGTFLTNGGDHRYLAGQVRGDELYLSTFDGAHAFLYKAKANGTDKGLAGDFWSGSALHERWIAKRDEQAALPDAYSVTAMRAEDPKFAFAFPDLAGNTVRSDDPKFRGKVLVIALGGSWCPNCHDEAAFLEPLYKEYRDKGLEIVSLMFEHFGDFPRAAEATTRFRQQYGIEYTTLIAGISDVDEAAKKLPMLQKFYGFPTTVIVDRNGQVRKIHTGFSGPATGEHYKQFVAEFRNNLNQLLAEKYLMSSNR